MEIEDYSLGEEDNSMDDFLGEEDTFNEKDFAEDDISEAKCNKKKKSKSQCAVASVFPASAFRKSGASVTISGDTAIVSFRSLTTASSMDEGFVKKILAECSGEGCDLINITDEPLWDVKTQGNKFFITRN